MPRTAGGIFARVEVEDEDEDEDPGTSGALLSCVAKGIDRACAPHTATMGRWIGRLSGGLRLGYRSFCKVSISETGLVQAGDVQGKPVSLQ